MLTAQTDPGLFFRSMDDCPKDKKVLLLNSAGIAVADRWDGSDWFIGWHPLPNIPVEIKQKMIAPPTSRIGALLGD